MSIRIAVAGLGGSGWAHCEQRIPKVHGLELQAVCDADPARLAQAEQAFAVRGYARYGELLAAAAVDLVVVATPTSLHAPMALAAMAAGKHVLVEKPLGLSRNPPELYENLRDVVLGQTRELLVTPQQARDVILVIDAIWESSRTGQVVPWRP